MEKYHSLISLFTQILKCEISFTLESHKFRSLPITNSESLKNYEPFLSISGHSVLIYNDICDISGWGSWTDKSSHGMSLMGQNVNINPRCDSNLICVENPSAYNQKDFTFDDGMPLICRARGQKSYIKGLHARKLDPCSNGCPRMKFLKISSYLEWINVRLSL